MAIPESNGRKLKEVFSKSRKEFEEEIRRNTLGMWPDMEVFLDQDDMPYYDWTSIDLSDETPSTNPSEKETTIKPLEKGPILKPLETESDPKPLDKKPAFITPEIWPPVIPFDDLYPSRPSMKWPPIEKFPTMRPFDHLPPIKSINEWTLEDKHINRNWDRGLPKYNYKFVFEHPTPPPLTSATHTGAVVMKVIGGVVAGFVALLIINTLLDKKNRTRRGVVLVAGAGAADQERLTTTSTDRRPSDAGEPGPVKADLPPPYYECAPYTMNTCDGELPPPYTYPEDGTPQDHIPRQNAFIENELRACSADVAPDVRTELVFDNGRIVERLRLDMDKNNQTGVASSDNVEEQSTRHASFKDTLMYVDETGNVKGHTQ